jgi:acyl-ACP thioesterase
VSEEFILESVVSYWDVDRDQRMTLGGIFKLLQEGAIKHADVYGLGAKAMVAQGESWVLNRLAAEILRYPRYEENLRLVTWSAGIKGFRGYRDLRVYAGEELLVRASTLWLYINIRAKTLLRVPEPLAEKFPVGQAEVFRPDLDKLKFAPPSDDATATSVTLRYGDFDGNAHLNNTAYFDLLQTALAAAGRPARPTLIEMQFQKEIPVSVAAVRVQTEPRGAEIAFGLRSAAELHAVGRVRG